MICRGSANSATVGSEIARIWPLRSVIIARCAERRRLRRFGAVNSACDRPFGPVRRERLQDGRVGQLADHREEQQAEAEGGIDQARARLLQCARGAAGPAAVTRTVSMRGTASARGCADALRGRAARWRNRRAERRSWPSLLQHWCYPLGRADRHRLRRRQRGAARHAERGTGDRPSRQARAMRRGLTRGGDAAWLGRARRPVERAAIGGRAPDAASATRMRRGRRRAACAPADARRADDTAAIADGFGGRRLAAAATAAGVRSSSGCAPARGLSATGHAARTATGSGSAAPRAAGFRVPPCW